MNERLKCLCGLNPSARPVLASVAIILFPSALGCSGPEDPGVLKEPIQGTEILEPSSVQLGTQASSDASKTIDIQAYIDSLYSPKDVRHTFTTKFNDVVDCVDFHAQPSVRALAKRGIAVVDGAPPVSPPALPNPPAVDPSIALNGQTDQNGSARSCPAGSVPYPRVTVARIEAAGGLDAYVHPAGHSIPPPPSDPLCINNTSPNGFAWALGGNTSLNNQGATTVAAVYDPGMTVESNCGNAMLGQPACEHSLAQLWITTGSCEDPFGTNCTYGASGNAVQSVELGWDVDYKVNGDTNPHIMTFSTQDGYALQGGGNCYNLTCNQFVQTSSPAYYPGEPISAIVSPGFGSAPVEYAFQIFNPGSSYPAQYQNWYVYVNGQEIGYYPGNIFAGQMKTQASSMEVGGEIATNYVNEPHADVVMGSGYPATFGFTNAAYHRDIFYLVPGSGSGTLCGSPYCVNGYCYTDPRSAWTTQLCGYHASSYGYSISTTTATGGSNSSCWGPYFYYGGGF
jgi:hypothetical protein